MKASPHKYSIGRAPTGRARCRVCKELITSGTVCLVIHATIMPGRVRRLKLHAECVSSRVFSDVLRAHRSVDRVPVDGDLSPDEADRLRACLTVSGRVCGRS